MNPCLGWVGVWLAGFIGTLNHENENQKKIMKLRGPLEMRAKGKKKKNPSLRNYSRRPLSPFPIPPLPLLLCWFGLVFLISILEFSYLLWICVVIISLDFALKDSRFGKSNVLDTLFLGLVVVDELWLCVPWVGLRLLWNARIVVLFNFQPIRVERSLTCAKNYDVEFQHFHLLHCKRLSLLVCERRL